MSRRIPSPSTPLKVILRQLKKPVEKYTRGSIHSLPNFSDNVYVRVLAAKPKMDILTRRIYPSTLLNKIGITKDHELGPVSRSEPVRGPRVWISASPAVKGIPGSTRQSFNKKVPVNTPAIKSAKLFDPKDIILKEVKKHMKIYEATPSRKNPKIICTLISQRIPKTQEIPENFPVAIDIAELSDLQNMGLPAVIDNRRGGIHLAGAVLQCKHIYSS